MTLMSWLSRMAASLSQPQPNTTWKIETRADDEWTELAQGVGGWYNNGRFEWGGAEQVPIAADAFRVSVFSKDDETPIKSIHFRGEEGVSWVVVGGAYEHEYVLSLRTDYAFGKAYPLMERVLGGAGSFGGHGHIAGGRITLDDQGESTIKSVERTLRANALGILGSTAEDSSTIPMEGRPLT